jgi:hypothetical protein
MSKVTSDDPDMLPEYDFTGGERGRYLKRFPLGSKVVALAPDVAEVFPDSDSVNKALRALIKKQDRPKATTEKKAASS